MDPDRPGALQAVAVQRLTRRGRTIQTRRSTRTGRRFWLVLAGVSIAAIAFGIATVILFVRPDTDHPRRADALVILGPGPHGERLREGLRLMTQGFGRVLVISRARDSDWTAPNRLCAGHSRFQVVCFRAKLFTTRGEAQAVAALASRYRWQSFLLVTSTYHVTRARLLYRRCLAGRVDVVGANPHGALTEWPGRLIHEWGGLVDAWAVARGC